MILDRKKKGALSKMGFKIKDTKTVTYKDGDTEKELTYKDIESFESQVKYILIYWITVCRDKKTTHFPSFIYMFLINVGCF